MSTMCQPQYESSVADADILISAKVIKVTNHLYSYLIFVKDTTDGVCVKRIARCKLFQI